jgi:hypothetical protein
MVMASNHSGTEFGILAGRLVERGLSLLGHLYGPGGQRGPWPELPYALDNGAYPAWNQGKDFPELEWRELIAWASAQEQKPLWAAVPDVVSDRERTLEMWPRFSPVVRALGIRPAFVLQDHMEFSDVPDSECMLFIGGTTPWKMSAIGPWCARFPGRVHVGRVTTGVRLMHSYESGAVSIDGNGWYRDENQRGGKYKRMVPAGQKGELFKYLDLVSNLRRAA